MLCGCNLKSPPGLWDFGIGFSVGIGYLGIGDFKGFAPYPARFAAINHHIREFLRVYFLQISPLFPFFPASAKNVTYFSIVVLNPYQ